MRRSIMTRILPILFTILLSATLACAASGYRNVSSTEAKRLIEQQKNIFLLDVRTPMEFNQARMRGSTLIPINEIERRLGEVPRNRPILVFCAVGSRSNLVAGFLVNKGYRQVYNMTDGLVGWYRNGYPVDMGR